MQQDIVPQKRKSIRDIPIPEGRSYPTRKPQRIVNNYSEPQFRNYQEQENKFMEEQENQSRKRNYSTGGGKGKIIFGIISLVVLIGLFAFFSRSYANIYIQAKELSINSNASVSVPFNTLESTAEKSVSVKATGEEKVSEKAKGKITIYNEYEEKDQRLLKDTRFESPEGLIFRIPSSVIVPALKRDEKGNVIPGKLEVEVVADQVGEKYNISATKFTVPGFKGLPQFDSFYAKSESQMSGGFDGIRKVISETDRQNAEKELKEQIKNQLINDSKAKQTENNLVIANDSMIVYQILGDKVSGDQVLISAKGTIKAISFDSNQLGNSVASATVSNFTSNENVIITNMNDLKVILNESGEDSSVVNVDVSGNINFKWQNNHEALKKALAGVSKSDMDKVVEQFPGITKIRTEVRPIWSGNFPEDEMKINIIDEVN